MIHSSMVHTDRGVPPDREGGPLGPTRSPSKRDNRKEVNKKRERGDAIL